MRSERLSALQWLGVKLAFFSGDKLGHATATKTLFYQLAVSALVNLRR